MRALVKPSYMRFYRQADWKKHTCAYSDRQTDKNINTHVLILDGYIDRQTETDFFSKKNSKRWTNLKGEFQICPRVDFSNILYAEYLRYNNYKNEIISFLEGC